MEYDILIIGGGPAGLEAYKLGQEKNLNVILIEANSFLGGQPVSLFPQKVVYDFKIPSTGKEIAQTFIDNIKDKTNIKLNTKVIDVKHSGEGFSAELDSSVTLKCKNIILAMGIGFFSPRKLMIDTKSCLDKIHYIVNSLDVYRDKKVIVLGGGDSAIDWANSLVEQNITNDVTLVHYRNEFKSNENINKLTKNNVKVLLDYIVKSIEDNKLVIESNVDKTIKKVDFDEIIVQYGQEINLQKINLVEKIKKDANNQLLVDQNMQTNISHVYAVGDIASYIGKKRRISHAVNEVIFAIKNITNPR